MTKIVEYSPVHEKIEGVIVKVIENCSRCGGHHEHVRFFKLTNPIVHEADGMIFEYWATCPTNGEPIIMAHVKNKGVQEQHYGD